MASELTETTRLEDNKLVIEDHVIKSTENFPDVNYYDVKKIFDALTRKSNHVYQIEAATGSKTTLGTLKDESISLALWLRKQGVKAGDTVALCSSDHAGVYKIVLATMLIQAIYTPWDSATDLELARYFINFTRPKVLFASKQNVRMLQEAAKLEKHSTQIVTLDQSDGFLHLEGVTSLQTADEIENFEIPDNIDPEQASSVFFSSGTTGPAKGVILSNRARFGRILTVDRGDRMQSLGEATMYFLSPCWTVYINTFLYGIVTGTIQILSSSLLLVETPKIIKQYEIKTLYVPLHTMLLLIDSCIENNYILDTVTTVIMLGSKVSEKVEEKIHSCLPNAFVFKVYGSTETGVIADNRKGCKNPLSTGAILPRVELKITDLETGEKLGLNETGEVCAKTPWALTCYYKDAETTAASFDDEGFFRTGDEAYCDDNGELVVVGRVKDIIRYKCYNIQPAPIETILKNHPNVTDVAIVGIPHDIFTYLPVAFVVTNPDTKVDEEELVQMISHLSFQDFLKGCVHFVDKLPYNTNGKINRRVLKELAAQLTENTEG